MPTANLRIDTSVTVVAGPSSSHSSTRRGTTTPVSSSVRSAKSTQRLRSASSASTSSTSSNPTYALNTVPSSRFTPDPLKASTRPNAVEVTLASPTDSASTESGRDHSDYVLAMHDYVPEHQNVTCLHFQAGQVIRVLNRDKTGWWDGEVNGRRGWFPSNYVTADVGLLTDEELPQLIRARKANGHIPNMSVASATSWTGAATPSKKDTFTRSDHKPLESDDLMDTYCPPLMMSLSRALSVLQNAVRTNRPAHFQPSTAYIISSVRAILTELGCLPRDAPVLKQHPILAKERKRILADLASLVSQAKKASEGQLDENQRQTEVEGMIRGGGQLFTHVRAFLVIASQCGLNVEPPGTAANSVADTTGRWNSQEGTLVRSENTTTPIPEDYGPYWNAMPKAQDDNTLRSRSRDKTATPKSRARSMSDLRRGKTTDIAPDVPALPLKSPIHSLGRFSGKQLATPRAKSLASTPITLHRAGQLSVSSLSSTSSVSSNESTGTPSTPVFPTGPSTTAEVMEALRHTHDHYLSTIAAFIGHAHSHSRTSHASSTGHMYDLVREVVEMVCKLLTIVEAVLRHPDIPIQKAQNLRAAKEGLYNVTSTLADAVRQLTTMPVQDISEEEEKSVLLRSATNALKAGADCVNAVKKCLQRATGERPFIVNLPGAGELDPTTFTPSKFSHAHKKSKSTHLRINTSAATKASALRGLYSANGIDRDDEDLTIQAQTISFETPTRPDVSMKTPVDMLSAVAQTSHTEPEPMSDIEPLSPTPIDNKPLPPLEVTQDEEPPRSSSPRPPSPVPSARTDDGTTWEGTASQHAGDRPSIDEKLRNGDLPAVPQTALPDIPRPDPLTYLMTHDHASEDVAYNSEGQLVGATLAALVERMTPHDSLVDPAFSAVFFMTFRQFTTPTELVDALITRYNLVPPPGLTDADKVTWQQRKGLPVRLRVSNFVKTWLENYWRPTIDNAVLVSLMSFTRDALATIFPGPSQRILELIRQWTVADETGVSPRVERPRDAGIPLNPPSVPVSEVPRPIMTKNVLAALRSKNYSGLSVTDFDALELARQLTTMECNLYCAIQPEEVLETGQSGGMYPGNVKAVTSLSTVITGWVAESILNEMDVKKRIALVKFFIKVADRCASLQNFSTPRSILAALDSSTISRLHQTWTGLPQKNKAQLEVLRKLADHARNYHEYRTRLRNTAPPAVPFLGLYLTDITFCREGNPSHRSSPMKPDKKLLNFNKYHKLARIVQDMQRFQVPYPLKEIPEVQDYLKDAFEQSKNRTDLQDLYRRSLLVEPKRPADTPPASDMRNLFPWASRSQASVSTAMSS